ncbi:MAG: hypothetical protein QM533_04230 [Cytophagales bacterium]|nr:hypothetical protein [Cytophagales bacterium]
MPISPSNPKPSTNCPDLKDLRTGDLLFPREPDGMPESYFYNQLESHVEWSRIRDQKLSQITDSDERFKNTLAKEFAYSGLKIVKKEQQVKTFSNASSGMGLDSADLLRTVLPIIKKEFKNLFQKWLGMTVDEFMKSPVGILFFNAIGSADVRNSFFVGHVGIVIREKNGQVVDAPEGNVYVIEDNITDYAHYRVAIHPYLDNSNGWDYSKSTAEAAKYWSQSERGWVNRRCALGQHVWAARLKSSEYASLKNDLQTFVNRAKQYHGRPFGFFDNSVLGDSDRMYCAEYVYRVFNDQGIDLNDKCTWGWMQTYLKKNGSPDQRKAIDYILNDPTSYGKHAANKFFVLHPAALWHSNALELLFKPKGSGSYA